MKIDLKKLEFVPSILMGVFVIYNTLSFSAAEMMTVSYIALGCMLLSFLCSCYLIFKEPLITKFDLSIIVMTLFILVITIMEGLFVKEWIFNASSILLLVSLFRYYRDNLTPLIIGAAVAFTISIYIGALQMLLHPEMWLVADAKTIRGYLLGDNYNQFGCRLICAMMTNILALRISRWFWLNLIPLVIVCFVILLLVQSMTSLSSLALFIAICLFPNLRMQRLGTNVLLIIVFLFEILVCFAGNGLHNNGFAQWLVVDVLGKDLTFTFRTYMWDSAVQIISKSPFWGYGFVDGEWFVANMSSRAIGPHNMMLYVLILGGIFGFALYLAMMFISIKRVFSITDRYSNCIYASIVVLCVMMLMEYYPLQFIIYLFVLAYYYPDYHLQRSADRLRE